MFSKTNEQALEALIEKALTGACREEQLARDGKPPLKEGPGPIFGPHAGYEAGHPQDFNREFAIDEAKFWNFLEATQRAELDKLRDRPNWQRLVLERLNRKIKKDGMLAVLKKGLAIDDAELTLLYALPFNDANPAVTARFQQNIFSVTRQVHYAQSDPSLSVDMVIFLNGLAIATVELKNAWTQQTVYHAKQQYMEDRDPNEPLFNFARCLVHFAVDTDEVWMTTKLAGKSTFFLPFNKGYKHGKGNPPNTGNEEDENDTTSGGHKSAYLWRDVLTRASLATIIQHFVLLEGERKDPLAKKTLIFPRYHQRDVVRKLLNHTREHGSGQRYLIQHSAGSGKSHSITWTAFQLIELYRTATPPQPSPAWGGSNDLVDDETVPPPNWGRLGGGRVDTRIFDSVVVVTDRRILDKQLRDNIRDFSEVKNIVAHAERATDLKSALESGKRIIITTIQKFPFVVNGIEDLSDKTFAVIIDEAHSSQGGQAADKMNMSLGMSNNDGTADDDEEPEDNQDRILRVMEGRRQGPNVSYFAFTATPKNSTLEKFGVRQPDGSFKPFHLYSMKQAIEEEFIMDVLANYTTYRSYYEIQKSVQDNPLFDTLKAQKKLRAYVEGHKETINTKAEIMVTHFMTNVVAQKKLKGKAKAMVVTRNIRTAIHYYFAIRDALTRVNAPFKILVAFSGKKMVDGIEYTEDILNGFPGKDIADQFESDDYRILVVANKFLTGFDEPLLHTMYVDKKLQGVLAVQTLSRLNRANKKMGKIDTFVLDFFNSVEEIKAAFDDFYTATSLSQPTDVNVLHDLKEALDDPGVYEWHEVEEFNERFFSGVPADQLSPLIDVAAARFNEELGLENEEKIDFKVKAKQFVKVYGQVACLIPFNNVRWEQLHWFLKFLIPKLVVKDPNQEQLDELLESVDLSTYGLERVKLSVAIGLDASDAELDPQNSNPRGYHGEEVQKDPLDEIIRAFNERWFTGWDATPEEQRIKFIKIAEFIRNNPAYQTQVVNNPDEQNSRLALEQFIQQAINQVRKSDLDMYKMYATDPDFKRAFDGTIMRILAAGVESTPVKDAA